jgi:ABC-type branched-subunit amino acid transport system substrate-binding protein
MMGGCKVEFVSADTGGNPAGAKTKAHELVERDRVDLILGPLASFELYAISEYIEAAKDANAQSRGGSGCSRPFAETMPAVTVPPRPNSLPTATTQSPTRGS